MLMSRNVISLNFFTVIFISAFVGGYSRYNVYRAAVTLKVYSSTTVVLLQVTRYIIKQRNTHTIHHEIFIVCNKFLFIVRHGRSQPHRARSVDV